MEPLTVDSQVTHEESVISPAISAMVVILPAVNNICEFLNQRIKNKLNISYSCWQS